MAQATSRTMTRVMWRLKKWSLGAVWTLLTTAGTVVDTCVPKELLATSSLQTLIYNGSAEPHCAWVIRAADTGDVIGMKVTDWITPSGFSCLRDRLVVRDGAHPSSPYLRIVCGTMCGEFNDDTEVVTSTNYMRVVYTPFGLGSLQHRGFTLLYRSFAIHPVKSQTAMYTGINYVLMCASVLVIGGLAMGLAYLFLREIGLLQLKKRQDRRDKLQRRRPAFSGQSGLRGQGQSTDLHISPPNGSLTPHHADPDTQKKAEDISSTDLPADHSLAFTSDAFLPAQDLCHREEHHRHGVGAVTSLSPEVTHAYCNGKTSSHGSPVKNHVPCVASPQFQLKTVLGR